MSPMHGLPIRKTRLRPPVVATDLVPRTRPRDALADGLARPLTLVCAPAGYGKTSLVSAHVGAIDTPVAWLTLEDSDATPRRLARLIAAAVGHAIPDAFADLDSRLQSRSDPRELASWLADELDEVETELVLVLDELERVSDGDAHSLLTALIEYLPQPLHLVVITRHDPPWPLASLRAHGSLREIRQADLAFRPGEVRLFVEGATGLVLDDDAVARIHERTEGWPAAVRMIVLGLGDATAPDELLMRLPRGVAHVEEFLAEAVLARQPEDVRSLLMRTALVERVDADLVDVLRGEDAGGLDGRALLEHLRRHNLFVSEDDGESVRLHALFREFLGHALRQATTEEEIRVLHDRARDGLEAQGDIDEAIDHALRGTRPESAVDVLARHRVALMNAERLEDIASWARHVRAATGSNALVLKLIDASTVLPVSELPAALDDIEEALEGSAFDPDERAAIHGEVHALRALDRGAACAFEEAAEHAEAALRQLPASATQARGAAWFACAVNAQKSGDDDGALAAAATCREEFSGSGGRALAAALAIEPVIRWRQGRLMQMVTGCDSVLAHAALQEAPNTARTLRVLAGLGHYLRNELEDAERCLRGPGRRAFPGSELVLARTLHASGRCAEADDIVASVLRAATVGHAGGDARQVLAARAELALRRGDVASAIEWADSVASEAAAAHPMQRPPGIVQAAVLVAAADDARLARADAVLDRVLDRARRRRLVPVVAEACAVRAAAAAARRDDPATVHALSRALELTQRGGAVRTYLDLAPGVLPYLEHPDLPSALRVHARVVAEAIAGNAGRPRTVMRRVLAEDLTNREEDVLELLADRLTNKEIAQQLHIAPETVKRHLGNVYGKLHVHGRREAVAKARALGLIPPR